MGEELTIRQNQDSHGHPQADRSGCCLAAGLNCAWRSAQVARILGAPLPDACPIGSPTALFRRGSSESRGACLSAL